MFDIICGVIFCYIFYLIYKKYQHRAYICECLKKINGPSAKPIIGNVLDIGFNTVDILKNLTKIQHKYGPISKIFIGPSKVYLFVSDPDLIEIILSSPEHIKKGIDYKYLKPWLLNGLLLSTGSYWQKRRKIITPTFHFKILDDFIPVFNSGSDILVTKLMKNVDKDVDIYPYITAFTLDSICETAMGTTVNAQTSPNNPYVQAVKTMCNLYISRKLSPWKSSDFLYSFSNDYQIRTKTLNIIHGFTKSVIEKRRNDLLHNGIGNTDIQDDFGIKKKTAFLDLLLKYSGDLLTDEDILEEVETFMFEGHDTTASALSFALFEIAKHPKVQNKIVDELKDIFGSDQNRQPTMQDLNSMKYLDLVIKETLRLYPSVPFFSRELEQDLTYKETLIPKGVTLTFFTYAMHNDPNRFKDPKKFDPERFSVDNIDKKNTFSFVPFSAGPRNCIGQKYAMLELKAALSKILRHFKLLETDSKCEVILSAEVILKSKNGVSIRLEKRFF